MEDIEIDEDRFMSFCIKVQILRILLCAWNSTTRQITERISQARKLFGSMSKQLLSNKKIPIDIRRRLYQAMVVNIALWGSESWALERSRSKLEAFHHGCLRKMCGLTMWDVAEKRIKNEHVRGMVANSPTMDTLMETRRCRWLSKLSAMKESRSPRRILGAWCTTPRPVGRPQRPYGTRTSVPQESSALKERKGS
jgi:hypothetical protein